MSTGVLTGRAIKLPRPAYPAAAQAVNAQGAVVVQLLINEDGSVASATAISGHPLLRQAAEKAAASAAFRPVVIGGKAVKVIGVVTFNFSAGGRPAVKFSRMKVTTATQPDISAARAEDKLHVWLYAIVERLRKGETSPTPEEAAFVHDGKAEVTIELTSRSPDILEKLKAAGFELTEEKRQNAVTGLLALDKLAGLADIAEVRLVLPVIK
jgi:TonB family protein